VDGGVVLLSWREGRSVVFVVSGEGVAEEESADEERIALDGVEEGFGFGEGTVDFSGDLTDSSAVGDFDLKGKAERREERREVSSRFRATSSTVSLSKSVYEAREESTHDSIRSLGPLLSISLPVRSSVTDDVSMDVGEGVNLPVGLDVDIPSGSSLSSSRRSSTVTTMEEFPKQNKRRSKLDEEGGRRREGIEKLNKEGRTRRRSHRLHRFHHEERYVGSPRSFRSVFKSP